MKLKINFILSLLVYSFVLSFPIGLPFSVNPSVAIYSKISVYILGLALLHLIKKKTTEDILIEGSSNQRLTSIILWGLIGFILVSMVQFSFSWLESFLFYQPAASKNTQTLLSVIRQYPLYIIVVTCFGPIMEELIFRRGLLALLSPKIGFSFSMLVSSFLFAIAHLDGHFLTYFSLAIVFCFIYKKTGSILTPIVAHCLMNLVIVMIAA